MLEFPGRVVLESPSNPFPEIITAHYSQSYGGQQGVQTCLLIQHIHVRKGKLAAEEREVIAVEFLNILPKLFLRMLPTLFPLVCFPAGPTTIRRLLQQGNLVEGIDWNG